MECLRRINEQTTRRDAITTPLGGTIDNTVQVDEQRARIRENTRRLL